MGPSSRPRRVALSLDPLDMSDGGMFLWAGILTALTLVASFFVAAWWQKRRDRERTRGG